MERLPPVGRRAGRVIVDLLKRLSEVPPLSKPSGLKPKFKRMKSTRIFYDSEDFRMRLDESSPAHYDVELARVDPEGLMWVQTYRIYGTDWRGNLLIYERRWIHSRGQANLRPQMVDSLLNKLAIPLNAIPGRLEVILGGRRP